MYSFDVAGLFDEIDGAEMKTGTKVEAQLYVAMKCAIEVSGAKDILTLQAYLDEKIKRLLGEEKNPSV
jgi:hypothetical protein